MSEIEPFWDKILNWATKGVLRNSAIWALFKSPCWLTQWPCFGGGREPRDFRAPLIIAHLLRNILLHRFHDTIVVRG